MSDLTEAQIKEWLARWVPTPDCGPGCDCEEHAFARGAFAIIAEVRRLRSSVPGTTPVEDDLTGDLCTALRLLALVKEWRDSDGNEPFPHRLRERIEEKIAKHNFSWHRSPGTTETGTRAHGYSAEHLSHALEWLEGALGYDGVSLVARALSEAAALPVSRGEASREREAGRADGLDEAAAILVGAWDDGDQGMTAAEAENTAEVTLLRSRATKVRSGLAGSETPTPSVSTCGFEGRIGGVLHVCNRRPGHHPPHLLDLFKKSEPVEPNWTPSPSPGSETPRGAGLGTCAYCNRRPATHTAKHGAKNLRPACDTCDAPDSPPPSETPRGAGLGTCPHGYDREPWLCDHCRRAIPSPSLPGDNHAEKEE